MKQLRNKLNAFNQWCLRKIYVSHTPYPIHYYHPGPLMHGLQTNLFIGKTRRLQYFWHMAKVAPTGGHRGASKAWSSTPRLDVTARPIIKHLDSSCGQRSPVTELWPANSLVSGALNREDWHGLVSTATHLGACHCCCCCWWQLWWYIIISQVVFSWTLCNIPGRPSDK